MDTFKKCTNNNFYSQEMKQYLQRFPFSGFTEYFLEPFETTMSNLYLKHCQRHYGPRRRLLYRVISFGLVDLVWLSKLGWLSLFCFGRFGLACLVAVTSCRQHWQPLQAVASAGSRYKLSPALTAVTSSCQL